MQGCPFALPITNTVDDAPALPRDRRAPLNYISDASPAYTYSHRICRSYCHQQEAGSKMRQVRPYPYTTLSASPHTESSATYQNMLAIFCPPLPEYSCTVPIFPRPKNNNFSCHRVSVSLFPLHPPSARAAFLSLSSLPRWMPTHPDQSGGESSH